MEQKILDFIKESHIAVFVEADRATGAVHIEKLGSLESWELCAVFRLQAGRIGIREVDQGVRPEGASDIQAVGAESLMGR